MKKTYFSILFSIAILSGASAQKYDFNWVLGLSHNNGDLLNFDDYDLKVSIFNKKIPLYATNSTMSTSDGSLVFVFNGIKVENHQMQFMQGTDSLKLGSIPALFNSSGGAINQASMSLPISGQPDLYRLFYVDQLQYVYNIDSPYIAPYHIYMAIIDMSENNGQGKVIEKNVIVISDTLSNSPLNAVKHANGRDWWLVSPEIVSNRYQVALVTNQGIDTSYSISIGAQWPPLVDVTTQSCFTQNGEKFVRFNDYTGIQIFDFDRCTGMFANPIFFPFDFNEGYYCGAAISYDSRFLYVTDRTRLHQYDLEADDIGSSKTLIGVYDGYLNPSNCDFLTCQLAPDGKIYINSWGGCKNLSVIDHPERKGQDCGFRQHGIVLNTFTLVGLPNMPNYRLGPVDGSTCDSLGLGNSPIAAFRYDVDSIGAWNVEFTDLSYYEPETWNWDFGDGTSSTEKYPTHAYDSAGVYQVCLTVSNPNGSNTYCKTLFLGVTGLNEVEKSSKVYFDFINSSLVVKNKKIYKIDVYNSLGEMVCHQNADIGSNIDLSHLVSGSYFWKAYERSGKVISGSFVKMQ